MRYSEPLQPATLVRRYKRFLADVLLTDGQALTVHTPNTGSMMGCSDPGSRIWLRDSANPKRKYRHSWELSETAKGVLVGVNTGLANALVSEAVSKGVITELGGYGSIRPEVRYGMEKSRIDLLLEGHRDGRPCYVEVKNVTAIDREGRAIFPDAVSARGVKHLRELMAVVAQGGRAVMCYCVQRQDARALRPADEIDPLYGQTLRQAIAAGVEALAYRAWLSPQEVVLEQSLPVLLS